MIAVGTNPASVKATTAVALDYLNGLQEADGHFRYSSDSDQTPVWVTGQVLVAAAGEDFPVAVAPRAQPATTPTPVPLPKPETLPPVPIPGVTSPSADRGAADRSGPGAGAAAPGAAASHAGPLIPGSATAPPPIAGAGAILPPASAAEEQSDALVEAAPASAVGTDPDDPASPWIPIGHRPRRRRPLPGYAARPRPALRLVSAARSRPRRRLCSGHERGACRRHGRGDRDPDAPHPQGLRVRAAVAGGDRRAAASSPAGRRTIT